MDSRRTVALPFYLTALVIMLFPVVELALTIVPWSPTVVSWRFGAVGLLVRAIMTPLVGLAMVFGTALYLEHRGVLKLVAVVSWFGASTLLLLLAMFALDLMEFRGLVRPESSLAFDTSGAMVLAKLLAGSAVLAAFGVSGARAARRLGKEARQDPTDRMAFRPRPPRGSAADVEGPA
jgi:hypothetical protein